MTPPRAKASPGPAAEPGRKPADDAAPDPAQARIEDGISELSYEQARDALVDVVRRLESGAETLEESLELWQRGEALARHCENWLAGARARIEAAQEQNPGDAG